MSHALKLGLVGLIFALIPTTNVWADEDDDSYTSYDAIVADLNESANETYIPPSPDAFDWDEVAIHGGVGLATTFVQIDAVSGRSTGLLKGFEGHFGVNLFSKSARAEGALRTFMPTETSGGATTELKEFELRVLYTPRIFTKTMLRMGGGVAARYMTFNVSGLASYNLSTPASSFTLGFERKMSPHVALGPDVSYRSSLISDTIDKSAWNASLRLNATF